MLVQEPQSVSQEKIDKFAVSRIFCIVDLECASLWVASADIACLSVNDANRALEMVC